VHRDEASLKAPGRQDIKHGFKGSESAYISNCEISAFQTMPVVLHHDHNPLHPFPAIAESSAPTSLGIKRAKLPVELLPVQEFDYAFDVPPVDPFGSPNRRQPWLSSILFSHESKMRSFARSKLNHQVSTSYAPGKEGSSSPRSARLPYNSPSTSRVTTAGLDVVISARSLEPNYAAVRSCGPNVAQQTDQETTSGSLSDRSRRTPRIHFQDSKCLANEDKDTTKSDLKVLMPNTSVLDSKDKDLQVLDSPALSSYAACNGKPLLLVHSKTLPMTPRAPRNSANKSTRPNVINLCDPVVPPLKLPMDDLFVSKSVTNNDGIISERKLRFSVPNDTYYRVRGSQSQRQLRGFVPYPISVANVAYPESGLPLFPEASFGFVEPKAPPRSAKSTGNTPRSPVVLSRTVFVPSPPEARAASARTPRAKDHIITAEMQMKGMLIEACSVSASLFEPVVGNAAPMYSGSGPKAKSTGIGDKVWSRTAKNAAAGDK
jgi:hypothetical protein